MKNALLPRRPYLRLDSLESRLTPNTHTWTDAGATHNWGENANWDIWAVPASGDDVIFHTADATNIQNVAGGLNLRTLQFNTGADVTVTLNQNLALNGSLATDNLIDDTGLNDIIGPGKLELTGSTVYIRTNSSSGRLRIASEITGPMGFRKVGAGTLELATVGPNTYTGPTTVADGVLRLNTTTADRALSDQVQVGDGVGGPGSAELELVNSLELIDTTELTVRSDGRLRIDAGEFEDIGQFTLQPGGRLTPPFSSTTAPLRVSGTVSLGGGVLDITSAVMTLAGTAFPLIQNSGSDPVQGTFAGLPEGATMRIAGTPFRISYRAGDGNDVALLSLAELPSQHLSVSGAADGTALEFVAGAAGAFPVDPTVSVAGFGPLGANVRATSADVDGDTRVDTILVTGPGVPIRMAVVSGADDKTLLVPPTAPFAGSEDFTGGGFVSAADLDGDGKAEWAVSPDQGGGPRVTVFSLAGGTPTARANFFGIDDPAFRGGCRTALADVDADGVPDLAVAAGFLGGPRVAVFKGDTLFATPTRLLGDFFAFPGADAITLRNGAYVAAGDVDGDGFADLVFGGGPGGGPRVFVLPGGRLAAGDVDGAYANPVANFFVAGNSTDRGGVRVAARDADGDNRADVVVGSGEGIAGRVRSYLGKSFSGTAEPAAFQDLILYGGGPLAAGIYVG